MLVSSTLPWVPAELELAFWMSARPLATGRCGCHFRDRQNAMHYGADNGLPRRSLTIAGQLGSAATMPPFQT